MPLLPYGAPPDSKRIPDSTTDPTGKPNGYIQSDGDTLWYFSGGHRYKITATLDDPAAGSPSTFLFGGYLPLPQG